MYAARLVVEERKKPKQLAEKLAVFIQPLRNWVNTYKEERDEKLSDVVKDTSCLDGEKDKIIQELGEENEIPKKAMYVFIKQT